MKPKKHPLFDPQISKCCKNHANVKKGVFTSLWDSEIKFSPITFLVQNGPFFHFFKNVKNRSTGNTHLHKLFKSNECMLFTILVNSLFFYIFPSYPSIFLKKVQFFVFSKKTPFLRNSPSLFLKKGELILLIKHVKNSTFFPNLDALFWTPRNPAIYRAIGRSRKSESKV